MRKHLNMRNLVLKSVSVCLAVQALLLVGTFVHWLLGNLPWWAFGICVWAAVVSWLPRWLVRWYMVRRARLLPLIEEAIRAGQERMSVQFVQVPPEFSQDDAAMRLYVDLKQSFDIPPSRAGSDVVHSEGA